jgi:Ca2+-binding EF-hand superfamily protein
MDFAAAYRKRAEALEAYLDQLFVKFETEREKRADEHLRSVFQNFDLDDSGAIDHYEFSRACERLNPTMSAEDVEDALSLIDGDGDGDISFDEFEKWWKSDHAITLREKADAELGKADEIDEVALVTRWETTRQRLEKEKLHRAFESIDEDGSGEIEFSEFRRLCRRMNAKMSDEEIKMTFAIVDADGSGATNTHLVFCGGILCLKTIILPRQARNKDRETSKTRCVFRRRGGLRGVLCVVGDGGRAAAARRGGEAEQRRLHLAGADRGGRGADEGPPDGEAAGVVRAEAAAREAPGGVGRGARGAPRHRGGEGGGHRHGAAAAGCIA